MTTPAHNFGPGGEATHAAMMATAPPSLASVVARHDDKLGELDGRVAALEHVHHGPTGETGAPEAS
jgi:hypothetical protein